MGPRRIFFLCKNEDLLRGIKQHTPARLTTMCRNARKPLLQTAPSVQSTVSVFALGTNCLPRQYSSTGSSSISRTLNLKINIYFHFPTNMSFCAYIRIHRNYIMSECVCKVNMNLPLPLFLAHSSVCLGTEKEESEHTETLGQESSETQIVSRGGGNVECRQVRNVRSFIQPCSSLKEYLASYGASNLQNPQRTLVKLMKLVI